MNPYRLHAYLAILIATVIWGVASPVIKFTLGGIDALSFLTYRLALSTIVAIVTFLVMGVHLPRKPGILPKLIIYGLFATSISLGLLFFGLEKTTVLEETLILLVTPLLITAAGSYFLKEHVTAREKVGMGIALVGTIFTIIEPIIQNGAGVVKLSGNIFILLSLIATVIATILAKELLRDGVKPLTLANTSFIVGFISLIPFVLIKYGTAGIFSTILNLPLPYQLGVFYMAFLSGNLAYTIFDVGQKSIETGDASVFSYLYPIFAAPLAVLWLGESITPTFILGGAVIVLGVIIAEFKKRRYN
jgi:drug/metabolite transporter (DMT)-like permease